MNKMKNKHTKLSENVQDPIEKS